MMQVLESDKCHTSSHLLLFDVPEDTSAAGLRFLFARDSCKRPTSGPRECCRFTQNNTRSTLHKPDATFAGLIARSGTLHRNEIRFIA